MKKQNIKKLFLTCLATASLLSFTSCDTIDDHDDDDDDDHRHHRGTTTTTTEEPTITRRASTTVETQTIQY